MVSDLGTMILMFLFRDLQSCGLRGSFGLQTCKTPLSARGLQNNRSRKGDYTMVLLMLFLSFFKKLRRVGIKIDFTF